MSYKISDKNNRRVCNCIQVTFELMDFTWRNSAVTETMRHSISYEYLVNSRLYTVSQKNVPPMACYNFDTHEWILIFFGRNVTDKVGNQKTLYHATSNNLCFCTTWQNGKTRKSHFFHSIGLCYTHNAPVHCLPERKKLSSVMCLIASNICWDRKISH